MKSIVFATHNNNKVLEVKLALKNSFIVKSLKDIGFEDELEESSDTLEGNAWQKARALYATLGISCFADDTGLEVDALGGKPGVRSARYASEACNERENIDKLLNELSGKSNRNARFRTVIALILEGKEYQFEGVVEGSITETLLGNEGFGYDPIFIPKGYINTFAEMKMEDKNKISHRGLAVNKLIEFLQKA